MLSLRSSILITKEDAFADQGRTEQRPESAEGAGTSSPLQQPSAQDKVDISKVDYDVDVLVIGGGGAGASAAIEAHEAGADVMIVTKLRIGDANTMMAEGGIQAADKENDSPVQHYLDAFGGGHFAARPELLRSLVMEAPDAIKWLNELGVMFDKDETGRMITTTRRRRNIQKENACMQGLFRSRDHAYPAR